MSDVRVAPESADAARPHARESRPGPGAGVLRRLGALARFFLPIVALVAVWWYLSVVVLDNPRIYPTPPDVADALFDIVSGEGPFGSPYSHLGATLGRVLLAFSLAYVIGTVTGVIAGRVKGFFDFSTSLVWIAFAVPSVVWVFIFLLVFGISDVVPVLALVVLLSAPVFIGTAEGIKAVPRDLVVMAQSYRVTRLRQFSELYLPSILPYLLANARVAFALGIKIVIVAEVIGLDSGVGLLVRYWSDRLYMAPVAAWAIVLIVIGIMADKFVFGYFERRARRWTDASAVASETS